MSWWVDLECPCCKRCVEVDRFEEGGTRVMGGSYEASLNVTYNYSALFREHLDTGSSLRWLDGKKASETIERLAAAVEALGTEQDDNYWKATPGNAGHALNILLRWAKDNPDAVWAVR